MKNQLKDQLTYTDLGGRRHLRRYVLATLIIATLILAVIAYGFWVQTQERAQFSGASLPLSNIQETQTTTAMPVNEERQTLTLTPNPPTATPLPPSPTVPAEACSTSPDEWTLIEIDPGAHLKRIEPACVYDGLARTVAWSLLAHMGYTEAAAAEMMVFARIPNWILTVDDRATVIKGMSDTGEPVDIELDYRPFHPNYRNWDIQDTSPISQMLVYALYSCYRTQTVNGDQVEDWGMEYPVVCILSMDWGPSWGVNQLDDHYYTGSHGWARRFVHIGYDNDGGQWMYMGWNAERTIEESQGEYNGTEEGAQPSPHSLAVLHGVDLWDTIWLEETYGHTMYPLPDGWQSFTDDAEIEFFVNAFETYYEEFLLERDP